MADDPRVAAARYRLERWAHEDGETDDDGQAIAQPSTTSRASSAAERAAYVEVSIQQAIRRGEFDNLPGAGKPLEGLSDHHDPDWWIKRKIQSEKLTGLGPPALMLRVESAEFAERLDDLTHEDDVRDAVEDFNRRVIEARRQLLGGPPVVTPTRDVDDEVRAWAARRAERMTSAAPPAQRRRRRWRLRRSDA